VPEAEKKKTKGGVQSKREEKNTLEGKSLSIKADGNYGDGTGDPIALLKKLERTKEKRKRQRGGGRRGWWVCFKIIYRRKWVSGKIKRPKYNWIRKRKGE